MKKTVLIAGKDVPECSNFVDSFVKNQRNVIVSGAEETPDSKISKDDNYLFSNEDISTDFQTGFHQCKWNRNSSLSTRSFVLQCENIYGSIDEVILYFDEEYFASLAEKMDVEEVSKCSDLMVTSYQNLCLEALARFEKSENTMHTLVFLVNQCPTLSDTIKNPVLRNGSNQIASPLVASCCSSFKAFGENIAALYGDTPNLNILLVNKDSIKDASFKEKEIASWLGQYMDSCYLPKNKVSAKKAINWIKVGSKPGSSILDMLKK